MADTFPPPAVPWGSNSRVTQMPVQVHFGDCDPAAIVFFPNFARWMDQASLHFFMSCGVPPWRELECTRGIIGTPVLETHTRYVQTATYGETLTLHTTVEDWGRKTFRHRHRVMRGDTLICEGIETRLFTQRDLADPKRIRAIDMPQDIKALCLPLSQS